MKSAVEIMHGRAASVVGALVSRAPAGSIRAAFAGGSLGRDEVWSGTEDGALTIYSDIDLYVVLADGAPEEAVGRAVASVTSALSREQDGVRFERGVDVGVYRLSDLLAQPARPGTVDLAEHHVWLHGDRAVEDALRAAPRGAMDPAEALYLLENRAWDALEAVVEDARAPRRARATCAKVLLDVGAAHLIVEGRYRPTIAARLEALHERAPASLDERVMETIATADRIRRGDPSARVDPSAVMAAVADAWCTLAIRILHPRSRDAIGAAALLSQRCRRGDFAANWREFVRLRRRARLSLVGALAIGWRFGHLAPVAALRTHALARALTVGAQETADALRFHTGYVARLASRVECTDGTLDERARAALRAVS